MMTLKNYMPLARKIATEQLTSDPQANAEVLALVLYNAYCDGFNDVNAAKDITERAAKRKKNQQAENDEYMRIYQEQMKGNHQEG